MSALVEFLYPAPAPRRVGAILGWWERRRLAYNVMVGGAGLVSLGVLRVVTLLPPLRGEGFLPWQAVVLFGTMANVCYLAGPLLEVAITRLWGREVLPVGPTLYRAGLTFSVGLALFPALVAILVYVVNVLLLLA